ncbi:unnamed protein product [Alternaria alternata]
MDLSISQAHANCVSVFLALIEASHSPSHKELLNETQDVFDRYKLWAGNVGAIHALLTFRKEHRAALYHSNEDSEPSGANTDESDESDSPWEVSSDSEVEQRPEQKLRRRDVDRKGGRPPYPAKPGLLDSTNFIVECLWRLPIRRPAPADRMKDKTVADTTGYLPFDLMYVRDKFPGLNETVAARLAKMISRRRQLIRYRKDHTDVLQEEKAAVVDISKPEHKHLPSALKADVASEPAPSLKAPSQRTEVTKATTLRINAPMATLWPTNGLYAQSVSESGSSIASEQTANAITIRLKSHLARHLEQLALFAIPQTDYMAALEEDDTSSNAARQGVASLSGSSTRGSIGTSSLRFSSQRSSRESDLGKPRTESGGLRLEAVAAASAVVSAVHGGSELLKQITRKRRTRKVRDQAQREWEEEQLQASLLEGEQQIALRWQQNQRELGDYAYSSELSYNFSGIDEAAPSDHTTMAKSRDVNEGPDTGYEGTRRNLLELSPPPSQTPPPSLRQRASRITSNILSPFRSRSRDGADFIARNVIEHTASFPGIPGEDWRNRNYNPFVKQPSRDINLDEENARLQDKI